MDNSLISYLEKKFGYVRILTLAERKDRRELMERQLGCGLPYSYSVKFPHNNIIKDAFNKIREKSFRTGNEYDCARNHYNIVKTAYMLGCESVMVMEDDNLFHKDVELIKSYFEDIPSDWDVLQMSGWSIDKTIEPLRKSSDQRWIKFSGGDIWGAGWYCLNRKAMDAYIDILDNGFTVSDNPLCRMSKGDISGINYYIPKENLCIRMEGKVIGSDLRPSGQTTEGVNTFMKYSDKGNYYSIEELENIV